MTTSIEALTPRSAWKALQAHYEVVRDLRLRKLYKDNSERGERLTAAAVSIYFDYSTAASPMKP